MGCEAADRGRLSERYLMPAALRQKYKSQETDTHESAAIWLPPSQTIPFSNKTPSLAGRQCRQAVSGMPLGGKMMCRRAALAACGSCGRLRPADALPAALSAERWFR